MDEGGGRLMDQRKYAVDFYLAGTVTMKANNRDEEISKVSQSGSDKFIESLENSGFGKYYVDVL
jgi:hypothetical protein